MCRRIVPVVACILLASTARAQVPDVAMPRPRWLGLRDMLAKRDFAGLSRELEQAQAAFEKSVADEDRARDAFRAFDIPDPGLEATLNAWVSQSPKSWPPRAARAQYYEAMARAARGRLWGGVTSDDQFQRAAGFLGKAGEDCQSALRMNFRILVCQVLLVDIFKRAGAAEQSRNFATAALRNEAASFLIRQALMHALTPRWGGSHERMMDLARESQAHAARNPKMKRLNGYVSWDQGNMLVATESSEASIPLFTDALKSGDDPLFLADRGGAYYRMKRYQPAIPDLSRAIAMAPDGWSYSIVLPQHAPLYIGACFRGMGRPDAVMLSQIERAEEINRLDPEVVSWRKFLAENPRRQ
jgi:tetratricopeptide (TPR) repeat protein